MRQRIATSEITKRHPKTLYCSTDKEYANLANELYDQLYDELSFMEDKEVRNTCISLALYFEDIHSGTRQFETFTRLYSKMYGKYVPFYDSQDASSPEAELDAINFIFWLSIVAERHGMIINPKNQGQMNLAKGILSFWNQKKHKISPNEELADYLFSEET
ncbi:MAG: DUF3843 family protein, partial [Prevotella sp.]